VADMNVVLRVVSREIQGGGFYQLILTCDILFEIFLYYIDLDF
jgi:hypothetical protein